ncbi:hypothetical protein [Elizabethkingia phage TCUEAP2]|nr:hypothetical protein [Elizabethkingia phage TCUEAP2]
MEFVFSKKDLLIIENKVLELKNEKQLLVKRKLEIQSSLSHSQLQYEKVSFKSKEFNENKERRLLLKNSLSDIEMKIKSINLTIKENTNKRIEIEHWISQNRDVLDSSKDLDNILNKIKLLKIKYKDFAKDRTRISSLRVLANEFIEELDKILK